MEQMSVGGKIRDSETGVVLFLSQKIILNTRSWDFRERVCTGKDVDTSCNSAKVGNNSKEGVIA